MEYTHLTPQAIRILEKRYLKKDSSGRGVESPRAVAQTSLLKSLGF